jgi:hypothetical protein
LAFTENSSPQTVTTWTENECLLEDAVSKGFLEIARLLNNFLFVTGSSACEMTIGTAKLGRLLDDAMSSNHVSTVRWLVEEREAVFPSPAFKRADVEYDSCRSINLGLQHVITFAIQRDDADLFAYLRRVNFGGCMVGDWGMCAAYYGSVQIVKYLRNCHAFSMSELGISGTTILMHVVGGGHLPLLQYLWDEGLFSSDEFPETSTIVGKKSTRSASSF